MREDESSGSIAQRPEVEEERPRSWGVLTLRQGGVFWGEDEVVRVRMSYATFRRHVRAYLQERGIISPTGEDESRAICYLQWVAHWHVCSDPEVEVVRKVL